MFTDLTNLSMLRNIKSRSISPENPTGGAGMGGRAEIPEEEKATHPARELGVGWKVRPYVQLKKGDTICLADIHCSGMIRHIWMVNSSIKSRDLIIRMYWDDAQHPAVECPVGDFFFNGWDRYNYVNCAAVTVNPAKGFNCFWTMPFRRSARITMENRSQEDMVLYYQIDYQECDIPEDAAYFHVSFNRLNPLPYKQDYPIADIRGKGHYVGTFLAYGANNNNWWGEGEVKFFMDGDTEFPTICTTGTEDYFLGAYNFENWDKHEYENYSSLYSGFYKIKSDMLYNCQTRFGMFRVHVQDPVYFENQLRVTVQCIGWRSAGRFHPQQDDLASAAFYYLDDPEGVEFTLPSQDVCEVI